ncbi:ROK family protein [Rhodococcus sp. 05-2254-6]|nr:ROK family protein [Rhodococcus sp. 05-2254-6]OZE99146.1 ROK family protein [Rhodococcus sp. 15-2388-1-1a]
MTGSPALSSDVGRHNLSLVMAAAVDNAPCARMELRERTGLVSGTVTTMVEDLIARGLLVESGNVQGRRGRPRRLLMPAPDRVRTVAVQLFPRSVSGEVRDMAGQVLWSARKAHTTEPGDGSGFVTALKDMFDSAIERANHATNAWIANPVAVLPAIVAHDSNIVAALPLGLRAFDVRTPLQEALAQPRRVEVINEGRLSALAEYATYPSDTRPRAMAYISAQREGVGGALVIEGNIYGGSHGLAGLVGHVGVDMAGPQCSCGARGCLGLYLSLHALLERAGLDSSLSVTELIDLLEANNADAHAALDRGGEALASAVGTMSNYTDVDVVVLGGILPALFPWLEPYLNGLIRSRSERVPHFNPQITLATYGLESPLTGAWHHARRTVLDNPTIVPYLS